MFLETICIKNRAVQNLKEHISRMKKTAAHFGFSAPELPSLDVLLPESLRDKKIKCRIVYKETIRNIEFEAYKPKVIRSLMLVDAGNIDYRFKYSDRFELNALTKSTSEIIRYLLKFSSTQHTN